MADNEETCVVEVVVELIADDVLNFDDETPVSDDVLDGDNVILALDVADTEVVSDMAEEVVEAIVDDIVDVAFGLYR